MRYIISDKKEHHMQQKKKKLFAKVEKQTKSENTIISFHVWQQSCVEGGVVAFNLLGNKTHQCSIHFTAIIHLKFSNFIVVPIWNKKLMLIYKQNYSEKSIQNLW